MNDKNKAVEAFSKVWWGRDNPVISQGNAELIWSGIQAALSALTNTSGDDEAPVAWRAEAFEEAAALVEAQWNHCWPSDIAAAIRSLARPQSAAVRDETTSSAVDNLIRAAADVLKHGATTGPQWVKLNMAIIKAKSAIHSTQEG